MVLFEWRAGVETLEVSRDANFSSSSLCKGVLGSADVGRELVGLQTLHRLVVSFSRQKCIVVRQCQYLHEVVTVVVWRLEALKKAVVK
jgi:hypothetical protein